MGIVTNRTRLTSRGWLAISPWNDSNYTFSVLQLNLGNNFTTKLEIVSALNSFNLAHTMYGYNYQDRPEKYNPKVYLSAVQSVAYQWIYDNNLGRKTGLEILPDGAQKSGS